MSDNTDIMMDLARGYWQILLSIVLQKRKEGKQPNRDRKVFISRSTYLSLV